MPIFYLCSIYYLALNFHAVQGQQACRTYPQGLLGTCRPIAECHRLNAIFLKTKTENFTDADIRTLRESLKVCSNRPTMCCENVTPEPLSSSHGLPSKNDCGHKTVNDNIIGGTNAENWWPWIVLLYGRWILNGREDHFCGGSLITDRFVITAAHCRDPAIAIESARIGELDTTTDPDVNIKGMKAPKVQVIPVAEFIPHPEHRLGCRTKKCNDIAIIKLAHKATLKVGFSSPICLPIQPEQDFGKSIGGLSGKVAFTAGWGTTNKNRFDYQPADHLQEIQLTIDRTSFCEEATTGHPPGSVICAGSSEGKDTCGGDSGGPLMLRSRIGTQWFLIGVISFGPTICGSPDTQGVYTSIHHYIPWIRENLK